MDSYSFTHKGVTYQAKTDSIRTVSEDWQPAEVTLGAAGAEILRIAEERDNFRRSSEWDSEQRDLANKRLDEVEEERDALKLAVEEASEINAEASIALAVLAGESLVPCGEPAPELKPAAVVSKSLGDAPSRHYLIGPLRATRWEAERDLARWLGRGCPGHLGPKAMKAYKEALAAHHALLDTVRERAEQPFARVLERHAVESDDTPLDTLRRIIRERTAFAVERDGYKSNLKSVLAANEGIESENRSKCLELAEKAGEIRELREMLEVARRQGVRALKLLALLDSEEPPEEIYDAAHTSLAYGPRFAARRIWRWLREQVAEPVAQKPWPPVPPVLQSIAEKEYVEMERLGLFTITDAMRGSAKETVFVTTWQEVAPGAALVDAPQVNAVEFETVHGRMYWRLVGKHQSPPGEPAKS